MNCVLQKRKGTFQHSSFLAGGATSAAGQLVVVNGDLKVKDHLEQCMFLLKLCIIMQFN